MNHNARTAPPKHAKEGPAKTQCAKEQSTKERLLEAGIRVFSDKGFLGSTVREICQEAGSNVAAINYHFGDKEKLYKAVLWKVFSQHNDQSRPPSNPEWASLPAEERLAEFIRNEVRQLYEDKCQQEYAGQHFPLFLMEMAHPSPFLAEVVDMFVRPDNERTLSMLREILGPSVPDIVVERCGDSLWGQILHHIFVWPIDTHLNPDRPHPSQDAEALAEHIVTFTLSGLKAIKAKLDTQRNPS